MAFFEAYGAAGYAVLERTIAALRVAGVLVLADAKRGDIGTTMAAYAAAWAGDSPLAADAVTASPYLGFGSLRPLLEAAAAHDRGVFVLAATSNPEGATVQRATFDGRTVAQLVVDQAAVVNRSASAHPGPGPSAWSSAPRCSQAPDLSALGGPVLVPGVGVQGGRPEALGGPGWGGARPAAARGVARGAAGRTRTCRSCGRRPNGCSTPSPTWRLEQPALLAAGSQLQLLGGLGAAGRVVTDRQHALVDPAPHSVIADSEQLSRLANSRVRHGSMLEYSWAAEEFGALPY